MYEEKTYEVILQQLLGRLPGTFDKREGSIIYDALAPAAAELAQMYMQLDVVLNQTFADSATGVYLEKRCAERGIMRTPATCAVVQGEFAPEGINMIGKRFSCGSYNYVVTEGSSGAYELVCETTGELPNAVMGNLIPIDYIPGLERAVITEILIPGEDAESDESLRNRYFENLSSQAFGGNIADYEQKTKAIDGVGGVKVTPVWNGGGTVKLTIIAADASVPSGALVEQVQGEMEHIAPIGHLVTVDAVTAIPVNVATKITYKEGWDWATAGEYIEKAIASYFKELSENWDAVDRLMVRTSGIEQKIMSCEGVKDAQHTTLNGIGENLELGMYEIPVKGVVSDEL